jgi:hypothetical protein
MKIKDIITEDYTDNQIAGMLELIANQDDPELKQIYIDRFEKMVGKYPRRSRYPEPDLPYGGDGPELPYGGDDIIAAGGEPDELSYVRDPNGEFSRMPLGYMAEPDAEAGAEAGADDATADAEEPVAPADEITGTAVAKPNTPPTPGENPTFPAIGRLRARTGPLADIQGNETDAGRRASLGIPPARPDYARDQETLARLQAQRDAERDAERDQETLARLQAQRLARLQAQRDAERDAELARMKANAGMKDSDYKTSPGSKRTAQDLALDKEYTYKAPDGRRLKYKHGDIRNAFHSSPDSRKAGSDKVIRGDRVGKRLADQPTPSRTNQDDRNK